MASRALPAPRAPHLRLIRPGEDVAGARPLAREAGGRLPGLLLLSALLLTGLGIVMVLSASNVYAYQDFGSSFWFFKRQVMYVVVGLVALVVTAAIPYRAWRGLSLLLVAGAAVLLVAVLHPALAEARTSSSSGGGTVGGATRWLTFGPVTIQPSEIAKLALVVFGAAILTRKWNRLDQPAHVAIPLLPVVAVLCGLVMLQPDLGTTMILGGITFTLLFVAGLRLRYLFLGGSLAVVLGILLVFGEHYRKIRFLSFLDPWADPHHTGYQVVQSLLALGSGGWTGVGLGASRAKWLYVPNAHTDFIFSIVGEELGLIGALAVLVLFGLLVYAGIRIAMRTDDIFGRLLAAGITGWLGLQALVNLGAVTGILPVTGVPLPFVSFGGSALVVTLAAVGILVNIARAPARADEGQGRRGAPARAMAGRARTMAGGRRA